MNQDINMYTTHLITEQEKENKKNSFYTSVAVHMLLILLLLMIPLKRAIQQEDSLQGVVVSFGNPDGGNNTAFTEEPLEAEATEEKLEEAEEEEAKETPTPKKVETAKAPTQKVEAKITEDKSPIVASKEKVVEKQVEKVEVKEQSSSTAAEAAAKAKAKADAEKQAASKSKFSSLFGQGSSGEVNEQKGDEFGQPDASVLEGLSKGKGEAGDGLDARGLIYEPTISDNSQRSGDVVVKVCVNAAGEVTTAKYTQRGSSTTDSYLINLAEKSAKKYRFTKSEAKEQCGTITIHFIVK